MKTYPLALFGFLLLFVVSVARPLSAQEKKNDMHLQTNLILAIRKNNLHDVKQALAEGADAAGYGYLINGFIAENWRPLQEAALDDHLDIARFLVSKGAPIDSEDIYGETPLMIACGRGHVKMAKWLLQHGARVDAQSIDGTALFAACSSGHMEAVKLLLRYKANVNFRDGFQRRTPLFYAAGQGHPQVVKLLLKNGAEVNAKNKSGETALTWAKEKKQTAVIAVLVAAGATDPTPSGGN